ncbi:MAG: ParB/RepB/Spo0J family partition protein [Candidatus Omnitrophica bacterium]|nr:ParB/RepB/Spo0J family partition protein [Candidatus Omnitrophota bacterium]
MEKKLGKGLGALIPEKTELQEKVMKVKVEEVAPNRFQPRKKFNKEKLNELIESIKEKGVIQPIIVKTTEQGYELIAGERRFRAVKELGYESIPAIVKEAKDSDSLELSLIENIQREELNSMEEATAYKELIEKFSMSQSDISKAVGKDKATISNTLRLLSLPSLVQNYIEEDLVSTGHAKALLSLNTEREKIRYAKKVIKKGLSVRQIEELVKTRFTKTKSRKPGATDENLASIEEQLQHFFGTRVKITHGKKRGRIEIQYFSNEDLERVLSLIFKK